MTVHHEADHRCSTTIAVIAVTLSRQSDVSYTRYVMRTRTETKWLLLSLLITITHTFYSDSAYFFIYWPISNMASDQFHAEFVV